MPRLHRSDGRAGSQPSERLGQEIARSLHGRDTAGAAYYLKQLRRDIARAAGLLACWPAGLLACWPAGPDRHLHPPPPRVFTLGWPEPDASDVLQVRHGDVIYANRGRWSWDEPERPDRWAGPAGPGNPGGRYTWDQLTALGELVEIPYERIRLPHDPDHD